MSDKAYVKVGMFVFAGVVVTALAGVVIALLNKPTAAQGDPPPGPDSTTTITTTTTHTTTIPTPPLQSEDRQYFEASVGAFKVEGYMVWRGNGSVASSGALKLGEANDSEKCRVGIEFAPQDTDGAPVGVKQVLGCPKDRPVEKWPIFGPVEFDNDDKIAQVTITFYLDGEPVAKITCPYRGRCVDS